MVGPAALVLLQLSAVAQEITKVDPAKAPEAVVRRHVEAYNAQDINLLAATLGLDVKFFLFPDKLQIQGKADCVGAMRQSLLAAPSQRMEVSERMVAGNKVIDHFWIKGRPDGRVSRGVQIYEVQNGLISGIWFMAD